MERCPVPGCENELPRGGFVCLDCHLLMPRAQLSALVKARRAIAMADTGSMAAAQSTFDSMLKSACERIAAERARKLQRERESAVRQAKIRQWREIHG